MISDYSNPQIVFQKAKRMYGDDVANHKNN